MSELVKIESHPDLLKDVESGAIISSDRAAFEAYINKRNKVQKDGDRIDAIERDLSDVKTLLNEILQRLM
jgi:hypothetical protein